MGSEKGDQDVEMNFEIKQELVDSVEAVNLAMADVEKASPGRLLTRFEIEERLQSGSKYIEIVPAEKVKSPIWKHFKQILYKSVRQNFVMCVDCQAILAYKSKTGTASLLRHKCEVRRNRAAAAATRSSQASEVVVVPLERERTSVTPVFDDRRFKNLATLLLGAAIQSGAANLSSFEAHKTEFAAHKDESNLILEKHQLEEKIRSGDPNITVKEPSKFRNKMWEQFKIIHYKNVRQHYIQCCNCFAILSYKKQTGTSSLLRHRCAQNNAEIAINNTGNNFGEAANMAILLSQVKFISKGFHSYSILDEKYFRDFVQFWYEMGQKFGAQHSNVDDLLSNRGLLQNQQSEIIMESYREKIRDTMSKCSDLYFSFEVFNLENDKNKFFITLDMTCVDESFKRHCFNVGSRKGEFDKDTVKSLIFDILDPYFDNLSTENLKFVLDEKHANMLEDCTDMNIFKIDCICENVITILDMITNVFTKEVEQINLIKQSKTEIDISIDRKYESLFLQYANDLKMIFQELMTLSNREELSQNIFKQPITELQQTVQFVETLLEAVHSICDTKSSTQNGIFLWYKKFQTLCQQKIIFPSFLGQMTILLKEQLNNMFRLKTIHKVALFLDPNFKNLKFLEEEERNEILKAVKEEAKKIMGSRNESFKTCVQSPEPSTSFDTSTSWLLKNFVEFMDNSVVESPIDVEIKTYLNIKLSDPVDVLDFWNLNQTCPRLKALAKNILAVPTASMYCRNRFAKEATGFEKICHLNENELESILFFKQNL